MAPRGPGPARSNQFKPPSAHRKIQTDQRAANSGFFVSSAAAEAINPNPRWAESRSKLREALAAVCKFPLRASSSKIASRTPNSLTTCFNCRDSASSAVKYLRAAG